jgi:hypothetical protein
MDEAESAIMTGYVGGLEERMWAGTENVTLGVV